VPTYVLCLVCLFLYSYEAYFTHISQLKKKKMLTRSFNATFRYIDDVRSLNNSRFSDFVDRIYHIELEIKDTTYTDRYASYLDLHLEIYCEVSRNCYPSGALVFISVLVGFVLLDL
jgi:hypothetical protein